MLIQTNHYSMILSDKNGALLSFDNGVKQFIYQGMEKHTLFTLTFLDEQGERIELDSTDPDCFQIESVRKDGTALIQMQYIMKQDEIHVQVDIRCPEDDAMTYWRLKVTNLTDLILESIDFPGVTIPNDLISTGGDATILWPGIEGVLIEDADIREKSEWLRYRPGDYPDKGICGLYPGGSTTQFMSYYGDNGGLYMGAHDADSNVKSIEFFKADGGIKLLFRLYPGGIQRGEFVMEYDMVLGCYCGDWHDAADIYRRWLERSAMLNLLPIPENTALPEWYKESPLVVIYPVRGEKDTGDMSPNEYFPYGRALPHVERLSERLGSKIMVLLMHWEGTAPWAPPYVWPPMGGEVMFREFVDELHAKGNLIGLYCSGIGWTNESVIVSEYRREEEYKENQLSKVMCAARDGSVPLSNMCKGVQRFGHDMCPTETFTQTTVLKEFSEMVRSGVDYVQFFDQNIGGRAFFCYSRQHNHPPAPGKWQVDAMRGLMQEMVQLCEQEGKKVLLGTEAAPAEPFIPYMLLNDLRFNIGYFIGKPVPLFQYLYHEYVNNFLGNQTTVGEIIDMHKSPDNLLYRTAYSFVAGEMLSVVLKEEGKIHWDWGTPWSVSDPNQDDIMTLIRNLNDWRRGAALPYLCYGRMLKPWQLEGVSERTIALKRRERDLQVPALLTSRWISPEGKQAQIIVNHTKEIQTCSVRLGEKEAIEMRLMAQDGRVSRVGGSHVRKTIVSIEPLSAVLIET